MKELDELAVAISEIFAEGMVNKGPMHIFHKECATGYIQSYNVRGLLAHYQHYKNEKWFTAAKLWTEFSIRMQGTHGHPAAYNMGYGAEYMTKDGVPLSWFVADTTDQATAILNMAWLLPASDPLYLKILESILKFDDYIQQWNLGEKGFALGYMGGENYNKESYHCAVARCISYYSAMYLVFNKEIYKQRGITLLKQMLENDNFNSNFHGAPSTNRCYASYALLDAYYILAENDDKLRKIILDKVKNEIIPWAIKNITEDGFWPHDRFGDQPGAPKTVDKSKMGVYTWGVLLGLEMFSKLLEPIDSLENTISKSYEYMKKTLEPGDINRWGHHSWATTAVATKLYPQHFFPMGARYRNSIKNGEK